MNPELNIYGVAISFKEPVEGIVYIPAKDEAHAREIVTAQYAQRENLNIVNIFDTADVKQNEVQDTPPPEVLN